MAVDKVDYRHLFPMQDPTVAMMELGATGRVLKTGNSFTQRYVAVFETKEGKLWRYREYWNPLVLIDAYGSIDAWMNEGMSKQGDVS
jgi:uncharacterized protein